MKMRKGGKRTFALCIALALVFGALWGTGIMPTRGIVVGDPYNAESDTEDAEDASFSEEDTEEENPNELAMLDEDESDPEDSDAEDSDTDTSDEEEPADSEEAEDEDAASEEDLSADGGEASDEDDADEAADNPDTATESTVEDTEAAETAADGNAAETTELPAEETAADEPAEAAPEEGEAAEIKEEEPAVPDETAEATEEQPAAMPEGSVSCRTAGGIMVSASFGENVFPEGVMMQATDLSKEEAMDAAADAVDGEVVDATGADITFYDTQGNEVEPYEGGEVNVSLSLDTPLEDGELTVVHIDDAGNAEELSASDVDEITEAGTSFTATAFSSYLVASFKEVSGELIASLEYKGNYNTYTYDLVLPSPATLTYDGKPKEPVIQNLKIDGSSYCNYTELSYKNNVNAGEASVHFVVTDYGGGLRYIELVTSFTIEPKSLNSAGSSISIGSGTYDGSPQKPEPTVQCGGKKLTKGTDYSVSYSNNTDADNPGNKATATVTGKGNYTGTIETKFRILQLSLAETGITLSPESCTYDGTAKEPAVTVSYNGRDLDNSNYDVSYSNNTAVGNATATVTVKAKGNNCTGSQTANFTINKLDLSNCSVKLDRDSYYIDESTRAPETTVTYGNATLTKNVDYTVEYSNNSRIGTATVTVKAQDGSNCTGSIETKFLILPSGTIKAENISLGSGPFVYDGTAKKPTVTVTIGNKTLASGTDFSVAYSNNVDAGTATVTVKGVTNYNGEATKTFTITRKSISSAAVSLSPATYTYDGTAKKPTAAVTDAGKTLREGVDYTVSYSNNTNAGEATVTIAGKGNYDNSTTKNFTISEANISGSVVKLSDYTYIHDGQAKTPTVTVTLNGTTLSKDTDYTVDYAGNTDVGTATVTVTGKNNYKGTQTANFYIKVDEFIVTLSQDEYTYTGLAITPESNEVVVKTATNGSLLTENNDYTFECTNNTDVGTATVTVTGKGRYDEKKATTHFTIVPKAVDSLDITLGEHSYIYDGTAKVPTVTVKDGNQILTLNTNYTVSYSNNINAGEATVTVTGKGNYAGTKTANFTIAEANLAEYSMLLLGSYEEGFGLITIFTGRLDTASYTYTYDGTEKKPNTTLFYAATQDGLTNNTNRKKLVRGVDYTVDYSDNVNIGDEAMVTVTGTGNYTGTKNQSFKIEGKDLGLTTLTLSQDSYTYDGKEHEPSVTVKDGGTTLTEGTDFTVNYFNNKNAGTAGVVIVPTNDSKYKSGSGNMAHFTISQLDLSDPDVSLNLATDDASYIRDYKTKKPLESVSYQGKTIPAANYSVSYTNNIYGPTASVTVTGSGNCKGSASAEFTIHGAGTIAGAEVTLSQDSYTYDGTAKKPGVTVVFDSEELVEDRDYTVSYSDNINAGKATVTIKGIGDYSGTKTVTFTIKGTDTSSAGNSSGSSKGSSSGTTSTSHSSSSSSLSSDDAYSAGSKGSKASYVVKGKKSVRYDLCMVSSKKKTAKVPSKVKIGKKTYKVTAVSAYAFPNDENLTSVIIGKNVKRIGKSAFCGCTNLKTLTIKSRNLTAKGVKNCLKDSSVETIIVPDGTEKHYAKLFAKENSGRGKEVKILSASQAAKKKL